MADKEATVYVVDLGKSMSEKHNGRKLSDLDYAMTYVWERITSTVCWQLDSNQCSHLPSVDRDGSENSNPRGCRSSD